jgi:hypothetical protein
VVVENKAPDLEGRGFVANSPLFLLRGCRRAPLYHLKLLVWAMVPLLNCSLKDRRNQFEVFNFIQTPIVDGRTLF